MENKFPEGMLISAKEHPEVKLIITKYYKRIYYCALQSDPDKKQLVYFEKELIDPS